jgi:hypothetical protein
MNRYGLSGSIVRRMNATDLSEIDGKIVLVSSARDHRNPPTAMRGTIRVREDPGRAQPLVQIELEFPQMFTSRAHHRALTLTASELGQLLQSTGDGTFAVTVDDHLDPEARGR